MTLRTEKVASLIQKEIGALMNDLELPFLTTVSKVEVSPDLKWAKIWITVLSEEDQHEKKILEILKGHLYDMQGELIRKLPMKIIPRISFAIDHSQQYVSHINKLLKEATGDE